MRFVICAEHIFLRLFICGVLTFLQTIALFLTVRFCGHRAFTTCPVLWTPRFYHLSGFVDTAHTMQRKIPVLWNFQQRNFERERQTFAKYHCFHAEFSYQPAAQNSGIMEFSMTRFLNQARQNRTFAKRNR